MGLFKTNYYSFGTNSKEYVPYEKNVTVNEHRAPTDESVRLLNEMEQKVKDNIISTILYDENNIKAVIVLFHDDLCTNRLVYRSKFVLNGREYKIEGYIDGYDMRKLMKQSAVYDDIEPVMTHLFRHFSMAVCAEIFGQKEDDINNYIWNH